jgi:5-methylcytosine-specific restriction endonuclease McrA
MYRPHPPYPGDWLEVAERIRAAAEWQCQDCGTHGLTPEDYPRWNTPETRPRILEVHHADGNPANCLRSNLVCLCKRCHRKRHKLMREAQRHKRRALAGEQTLNIPPP